LVVDLTGTTYLDSTAVRLLFDLAVRLQARRRRLRLVVSDATIVRRVLVLTKLDQSVPFDTTVEDAVAHCADPEEHETSPSPSPGPERSAWRSRPRPSTCA